MIYLRRKNKAHVATAARWMWLRMEKKEREYILGGDYNGNWFHGGHIPNRLKSI